MTGSDKREFSRWRSILWPIHMHELKKLVPMLLIFFLITFNYNVLRTLKDTLVVTAKDSGAEAIPFIKMWVMFPGAIGMLFIFTRLANRLDREKVIYTMLAVFLLFFAFFTFVLYPMRDTLHPHAFADHLREVLPEGCKGLVAMLRNWTFTIFYAMAELWSSVVLSVLFWGFANQVTRLGEAKRFYGLFGIGANFSGVVAGQTSVWLSRSDFNPNLPFGSNPWEQTLVSLTLLILAAGAVALFLFRWMHTSVLTDPRFYDASMEKTVEEKKEKQSVRKNLRYLMKSKYLMSIAFIVFGYNVIINLVEVVWKHQLHELYPSPSDYNLYFNQVTTITGVLATLIALFVSGNSIRKLGWTFTAMLTPAILLLTSFGFFGTFFFKDRLHDITYALLGMSPLALVVFFGSLQNVLSRAAKYTVYDATKEMAYIPLGAHSKERSKAAIDGVCSRFGKASGALTHQTLLLLFSTITASAPYVAMILFGMIGSWIAVTRSMGRQFRQITGAPAVVKEPIPSADIEEPALATQ